MNKLTLSLLCIGVAFGASAEVLTPAEALQRAGNAARIIGKSVTTPAPVMTVAASDNLPALYLFDSMDNSGFMVLSADDLAMPVLGYADSGSFDPEKIPSNMKYWLDFYAAEIAAVRSSAKTSTGALRVSRPERTPIAPICKTTWNQDSPYNLKCPKSGLSATYTGCVATAMAQVLKTYEYPEKCSGGTFSYTADELKKTISLNFDDVTLDWANMLNSYSSSTTTEQKNAVANLMYAVAVSSQMDFGVYASGTLGLYMASGLVRNFGYDESLLYVNREWYTFEEWETMIYDQLATGHAAYYDGSNDSGHAFVVDGYQGDGYFHLNWGWGGVSDGYFLLSALDPLNQGIGGSNAGYNLNQGTMLNMKPADGQTTVTPILFILQGTFTAGSTTATKGASARFTGGTYQGMQGGFFNVSTVDPKSARLGVKFTATKDGKETYAIQASEYKDLGQYYGAYNFQVTIPSTLSSGTYVVTPVVRDGEGNTFDVKGRVGGFDKLYATVAGNKVTFTSPEYSTVDATYMEVPATVYQNTTIKISATLTNPTEEYFNGTVTAAIVNYDGATTVSVLDQSLASLVNLAAGESEVVDFSYKISTSATRGSRYICLIDELGYVVSDLYPVTVATNPGAGVISKATLTVSNKAKNNLTFEFPATCSSGYYSNSIVIGIFQNGTYLTQFASDLVNLNKGESTDVTVNVNFTDGVVNRKYQAIAYYIDSTSGQLAQCSSTVQFTLQNEEEVNVIEDIMTDMNTPIEYFDVLGRKVATPKSGNVYIMRQNEKPIKIYIQ